MKRGVVELDEERKAAMVSNLLVVLCGNRDAQPDREFRKPVLGGRNNGWLIRKRNRSRSGSLRNCTMPLQPGQRTISARLNGQIEYLLTECVRQRKKNGKYVPEHLERTAGAGHIDMPQRERAAG